MKAFKSTRSGRFASPVSTFAILSSCVFVIWLSAALCAVAFAQEKDESQVESLSAVHTDNHPKIDGLLGDACWQRAPKATGFVQNEPEEGKPPSEPTSVQVAYSEDALYVAMEMHDSQPDRIVSRLTRRDREQDADYAFVTIDSYHDHQTAYMFLVYASGTQHDVYYFNDSWSDGSWDAVWESATRMSADGWTAEFKIPFDCLRFPTAPNHTWGILCGRHSTHNQETDRWPYIPESASGLVSGFAHLTAIEGITPAKQLEMLPYAVSYEETEAKHPGNQDGRDFYANTGVDLKYGITPNMTLSATFNPDFGQVEADQTVLNLTAFETTYPEKRPFFLEGTNIFSTWSNLFYSRRIGKAPSRWMPDAADYVDRPGATTILGAVKLTGKTEGGTSIGLVEAVTQKEIAEYLNWEGARKTGVVEPEANYLVARVKQDVLRNSYVGAMATAVNQNTVHPAYTGGVDWIMRFSDGEYASHGQVVGSLTGPDKRGWGAFTRIAKEGGEHILANVDLQYMDRNLNLNRAGYLARNSTQEISTWTQFRTSKKWWIVNRSWHALYCDLTANLDGLRQNYGCDFDNDVQFTNYWSIDTGCWLDFGTTDFDWETRGGPPVHIPLGQSCRFSFSTDSRKSWRISPYVGGGDTWDGRYTDYILNVTLRPRSNIELTMAPRYKGEWGVSRWLKAIRDESGKRTGEIFGEQQLTRVDMTVRGTFTFTRDLSLQLYAQPFLAAVDYKNFKRRLPGGTYEPVDASVYDEAVERPDFNWNSFNSNVVLRWEYMPGSTLFLVWTQAREYSDNLGTFDLDHDMDYLFDTVPGNTFLVKASYRISM